MLYGFHQKNTLPQIRPQIIAVIRFAQAADGPLAPRAVDAQGEHPVKQVIARSDVVEHLLHLFFLTSFFVIRFYGFSHSVLLELCLP